MSNESNLTEPPSDRVYIRDEHILVIDELEIKDPEVVELVKQRIAASENVEDLIEDLIKIGAKAALVFNANTGAETIKNAIETAQRGIAQSAQTVSQLVEGELKKVSDKDGDLQKGIAASVDKLSKDLEAAFSGEDTPLRNALSKSLETLSKNLTENVKERLKDQKDGIEVLLDPSHPTSPLRSLLEKLESLNTTVNDVQAVMTGDSIRQEVESNAPIGGVKYEEQVVQSLKSIALAHNDLCEGTGNTTGYVRNSKRGDAVVEFLTGNAHKARIVAEAKDKRLTSKEWLDEAKEARRNRRAEGFIGLCKSPELMPNEGQRIWISDMKTVVLAFDPTHDDIELLRSIYQFVKLTTMTRTGSLDADSTEQVLEHLQTSITAIERFNEAEKHITSIDKASENLRKGLKALREDLEREIHSAQRALLPVEADEDIETEEVADEYSSDEESVSDN